MLPIFFDLLQLCQEVVEVELVLLDLALEFAGFGFVVLLLCAFDERDDVAHVIGMAVRQRQGIQLARAHVNPQRAKGARPHVAHERKGTLHPREGIDAARLHQI